MNRKRMFHFARDHMDDRIRVGGCSMQNVFAYLVLQNPEEMKNCTVIRNGVRLPGATESRGNEELHSDKERCTKQLGVRFLDFLSKMKRR
jgi:hypothetical protein